jgi:hypothetical protein
MTAIFKRHDNLFTGMSSRRCPRSGDASIVILELIFVSRQTISHGSISTVAAIGG